MSNQASSSIVNGETVLFGIIGDPIKQVRSPTAINALMQKAGTNAIMVPLHVLPEQFDKTLSGLMALGNLQGIVVTIPHKFRAAKLVQRVLPTASRVDAINVLRKEADGTWTGDNFDGKGFVRALLDQGASPVGLRVMLLGAGGAGSAIADALLEAGINALKICDISEEKAQALVKHLKRNHPKSAVTYGSADIEGTDLLVNATPIGLNAEDKLPLEVSSFPENLIVADIVTRVGPTPLLQQAMNCNCQCVNGQAMIDGQAVELMNFLLNKDEER